jgi:hypothetical protein
MAACILGMNGTGRSERQSTGFYLLSSLKSEDLTLANLPHVANWTLLCVPWNPCHLHKKHLLTKPCLAQSHNLASIQV